MKLKPFRACFYCPKGLYNLLSPVKIILSHIQLHCRVQKSVLLQDLYITDNPWYLGIDDQ